MKVTRINSKQSTRDNWYTDNERMNSASVNGWGNGNAYDALMGGAANTYDEVTGWYTNRDTGERWRHAEGGGMIFDVESQGKNSGATPTGKGTNIGQPNSGNYGITLGDPNVTTDGPIVYNSENGVYGNVQTKTWWIMGDDGNVVYTDQNGNPLNTGSTAEEVLTGTTEEVQEDPAPTDVPTDTDDTRTQSPFESQEDAINSRYDALQEATRLQLEQGYNASKSQYEKALADALPQYQKQREQQAFLTAQNEQKIKEYSFYTGDTGGMSRQDVLQNVNSGQEAIGAINLQEQLLKDDNARILADLFADHQTQLALTFAQFAAEREAALAAERIRLQESNAAWQQWLTSETGYMPDGTKTMDREALEFDIGKYNGNSGGSTGTSNTNNSYGSGGSIAGDVLSGGSSKRSSSYASVPGTATPGADWQYGMPIAVYDQGGTATYLYPGDPGYPRKSDIEAAERNEAMNEQYSQAEQAIAQFLDTNVTGEDHISRIAAIISSYEPYISAEQKQALMNEYGITQQDMWDAPGYELPDENRQNMAHAQEEIERVLNSDIQGEDVKYYIANIIRNYAPYVTDEQIDALKAQYGISDYELEYYTRPGPKNG